MWPERFSAWGNFNRNFQDHGSPCSRIGWRLRKLVIKSPFNGLHQPIGPRPLHLTNFPRRKISTLLATSLFVFNTFTLSACGGGPRDGNIHNRGNLQGTVVQEGPVNKDNPGGIIIINKGPGKTEIWEYPAYDNNELDNDEGGVIIVSPGP